VVHRLGTFPPAQYLVRRGATVNTANGRRSARQGSAELDNTALVQLLLDTGADIECRHDDDLNALHYATRTGRIVNIKILLKKGAGVNPHNCIVGGTDQHVMPRRAQEKLPLPECCWKLEQT